MEKKKSLLSLFIIVMLTHIYLFANLKVMKETLVAPKPTNSSVQINLKNIVIKKQEIKQIKKPIKKIVKKKIIKELPKTESKNIIKTLEEKRIVKKQIEEKIPKKIFEEKVLEQKIFQKVKNVDDESNILRLKAIENEYLLKLKKIIEENKIYPNSAKRLNQMGKVYINFTINKNGDIQNIQIKKNSSYKRLDEAAKKILLEIKKFKPIPKELNKNSWNITVPILYQIIRS